MANTLAQSQFDNKKILQYPLVMVYDDEYIVIKIYTDKATTKLQGDADAVPTPKTNPSSDSDIISFPSGIIDKVTTAVTASTDRAGKESLTELDKVIVLPMPNDHSVTSSIEYTSNYQPMAAVKLFEGMSENGLASLADVLKLGAAAGVSAIANRIKSGSASTDDILAQNRLIWNPKKEVMFEDFHFRRFTFNYMFSPKSESESQAVSDIITTLRYYALPQISESKLFYIFPSEFKIMFYKGKTENVNVPKMTPSVLTNIRVNYTPYALWSSLPNGASTAIQVSMEFLELELVDRTKIQKLVPDKTNSDKKVIDVERSGY